jgi:hypothetical protein
MIVQRHLLRGWCKEHRAGDKVLLRGVRKLLLRGRSLSDGDVSGGLHEGIELGIGDLGGIHEKGIHTDPVNGPGIVHILMPASLHSHRVDRAHTKLTTRYQDHPFRRGDRLFK